MKKNKNKFPGFVRVIGGQWKRRRIHVFNHEHLRPTTDMAREMLFNWLGSSFLYKSRCLDCFAGTGILSVESLSRFASFATLIESNFMIAKQIVFSLKKFNINNARVIHIDALRYLKKLGTFYDVVFLDPPFYREQLLKETVFLLEKNQWITKDSRIYVETNLKFIPSFFPKNWVLYKKKFLRRVSYFLYVRR